MSRHGTAGAAAVRRFLNNLMGDCGLTPYAGELGLGAAELAAAADSVDTARLANNPRRPAGRSDLLSLFETGPAAPAAAGHRPDGENG